LIINQEVIAVSFKPYLGAKQCLRDHPLFSSPATLKCDT
jgi:hypothetical protein